jgi:hypothetical protein
MGTYAKAFAGGATTANTVLALAPTTGWEVPPGSYTITTIRIASVSIVNAKEQSGFVIVRKSNGAKYVFAFGGGTGGATNAGSYPAEEIECSIPISVGEVVYVDVLTAEVHNDTRVSLMYEDGLQRECLTLAAGGAGQDVTAGTELTLTANALLAPLTMTPWRDCKIMQIRVTGAGIVDALAQGRRILLEIPGSKNTYEFVAGNGPGGAATALGCGADVIGKNRPLNIPVTKNTTVTAKVLTTVTTGAAVLSAAVSLTCM